MTGNAMRRVGLVDHFLVLGLGLAVAACQASVNGTGAISLSGDGGMLPDGGLNTAPITKTGVTRSRLPRWSTAVCLPQASAPT